MTVRRKTLLIIAITCLGLVVVLFAASRSFLLGGFIKLEQASARENMERVQSALEDDIGGLRRFTADRSASDQLYNSMIHPTNASIAPTLGADATGNLSTRRYNFVVLLDTLGQVVAARSLDLATRTPINLPESLKAHFSLTDPLLMFATTTSGVSGVLLLPEGPLLIASRPIVKANNEGPIHGTLLTARYLESGDLQGLEETIRLALAVRPFNGSNLPADFEEARLHLSGAGTIHYRTISNVVLDGYVVLNDIYGKPALILRAEMPRVIYQQGRLSELYFLGALLIAGIVFGGVVQLLLERSVVSRLSSLNNSVRSIANSGDASARVHSEGRDEIANLGEAINRMLGSLQLSQKQQRLAEERYRTFMNNIPAIALIKDSQGRVLYINEPMSRIYNIKLDDMRGKFRADWIPEEIANKISLHDQEVLSKKRSMQFEEVIPTPDGIPHYWLNFRSLSKDRTGSS
jgi:PAS domain S-box-containing protein